MRSPCAVRAAHARADCLFHSDHVEHVQLLDMIAAVGGNRRALLHAEVLTGALARLVGSGSRANSRWRRVGAVMGNRKIPSKRKQHKASGWVLRVYAQNQNKLL